ncbi:MAG: hypothetical protein LBS74_09830 [Oscillospiraceae bacterium]|nr:hypothetical protein [Oscillospiraceae bacterium]
MYKYIRFHITQKKTDEISTAKYEYLCDKHHYCEYITKVLNLYETEGWRVVGTSSQPEYKFFTLHK